MNQMYLNNNLQGMLSSPGTNPTMLPGDSGEHWTPPTPNMSNNVDMSDQHRHLQQLLLKYIGSDQGQALAKTLSTKFPIFNSLLLSKNNNATNVSQTLQNQVENASAGQPVTPASEAMYNGGFSATPVAGGMPANNMAQIQYQNQASPLSGFAQPT